MPFSPIHGLLTCLGIYSLSATALLAQQFVEQPEKRPILAGASSPLAIAPADVNGDGLVDLLLCNEYTAIPALDGRNSLFLGVGNGFFTEASSQIPSTSERSTAAVFFDADGDTDLDLVVGNFSGPDELWLNDGNGTFTDASSRMPADVDVTFAVVVFDVDGDGDADIVWGNSGPNRLYLGDGKGNFSDASAWLPQTNGWTRTLAFADVDSDGDLDVFEGNDASDQIWRNDGSGRFTVSTNALVPKALPTTCSRFVDVDGDGDVDLVIGVNGGPKKPERDRIYRNDGKGVFREAPALLPATPTFAVQLRSGDFDTDGDMDLIFADDAWTTPSLRLLLNNGAGTFTASNTLPNDGAMARTVAAADVDGDLDLDLVLADHPANGALRIFTNDGKAVFSEQIMPRIPRTVGLSPSPTAGDLDGDGDFDIAVAGGQGSDNRVLLGDGRGNFVLGSRLPRSAYATNRVALADVDADGDLDWISANMGLLGASPQNRLFLNDGSAQFTEVTATQMPTDTDTTYDVVAVDIDNDRDADLIFANNGQNRVYVGDGVGNFKDETSSRLPARIHATNRLAVGDLDGDGDLDFVAGNGSPFGRDRVRIYLNSGTGQFVDASTGISAFTDFTYTVKLADLDGDRDLDLVTNGFFGSVRLFLNDGAAKFTDVSSRLSGYRSSAVTAECIDIDDDGDIDIYFGRALFLNDGLGFFRDVASERLEESVGRVIPIESCAVDADLDGDLDLVVASGQSLQLISNRHRQLYVPQLLVEGSRLPLEFALRPGYAPSGGLVIPLLSAGSARTPIRPFGVLGLGLTSLVVLPTLSVGKTTGTAQFDLPVPRGLLQPGSRIYLQGLVLDGSGIWRFTNVTEEILVR